MDLLLKTYVDELGLFCYAQMKLPTLRIYAPSKTGKSIK